ncbi:MAG: hypothetical protein LH606_17470 [Cytophagaceae bacterium]|nr:hypothetical protein [Cytophagaceae bacterium]
MKTETITPLEIAESYSARIRQAVATTKKQAIVTEWRRVYDSFSPEQKKEVAPHFERRRSTIDHLINELDVLAAKTEVLLQKYGY